MRIRVAWLWAVVGLCLAGAAGAEPALGAPTAPVTVVEYGSLTCAYCVRFHREVLPQLRQRYIDTKRVRFIHRDFPTSAAAMRGAVAARCAGADRYYAMLDTLYGSTAWSRASDVDAALIAHAVSLGLHAAPFRACLADPVAERRIERARAAAATTLNVLGTPTFLVNGRLVRGMQSLEQMEALIEDARVRPAAERRPRVGALSPSSQGSIRSWHDTGDGASRDPFRGFSTVAICAAEDRFIVTAHLRPLRGRCAGRTNLHSDPTSL